MDAMKSARTKHFFRVITRVGTWLASTLTAAAVVVHHWLPHVAEWFPVEIRIAIAILLFGYLADRILTVEDHVKPHLVTYLDREAAYNALLESVKANGASQIDLLQFSGQTAVPFLRGVAAMNIAVTVRLFVVDDIQASKFDESITGYHASRIKSTCNQLGIVCESHPNFKLEVYRYSGNGELSAIIVDDFYGSVGWNRSYVDDRGHLLMRGHNTPGINVENDHSLLKFMRAQVKLTETSMQQYDWRNSGPFA